MKCEKQKSREQGVMGKTLETRAKCETSPREKKQEYTNSTKYVSPAPASGKCLRGELQLQNPNIEPIARQKVAQYSFFLGGQRVRGGFGATCWRTTTLHHGCLLSTHLILVYRVLRAPPAQNRAVLLAQDEAQDPREAVLGCCPGVLALMKRAVHVQNFCISGLVMLVVALRTGSSHGARLVEARKI